jgi:hypothetical protein
MRKPGGRAPFLLGTPKDMPSKALEMGVCFQRGPVLENLGEGRSFPRPFKRRVNFFLLGELVLRNSYDVFKKALETGNSLHRDPPWGKWSGFVYRSF